MSSFLLLIFITPILGAIRNYIKYRKFGFLLFLRSPVLISILYFMLSFYINPYSLLFALILERWILLLVKTIISVVNDDYYSKKIKYANKYNIKYLNWKSQVFHKIIDFWAIQYMNINIIGMWPMHEQTLFVSLSRRRWSDASLLRSNKLSEFIIEDYKNIEF